MAPTEILAEQHARTLTAWAEATGRSLALLTASTPRAARESQLALLAAGKLDIVVGTHALLAERVSFARLGVVVIDEQHRFGVAQRALLRDKGGMLHAGARAAPHLLVMTATPIPRTLALTAYGDLDLTILDELPPGREPPRTRVLHGKTGRARALDELRAALDAGRQAYWVCPLIEESETRESADIRLADGLKVAEEDLRIRGPGEIFGTRQAGLPRLRYADLVRDVELLRLARAEAFALLESDPQLAAPEHASTRAVLDARWAEARLFGE